MKKFLLISIAIVLVIVIGSLMLMSNTNKNQSVLGNIKLVIGMPRAEVEKLIADALKVDSEYNVYEGATITTDQVVEYTDGTMILEVTYKPGSPAPWVLNSQGVAEHYSPIDQSVKSFHVYPRGEEIQK